MKHRLILFFILHISWSSITTRIGNVPLSHICATSHRAKSCNLCARGLYYGVFGKGNSLRRDICTALLYCDKGCQFNSVLHLLPNTSPNCSVNTIAETCGETATTRELQEAVDGYKAKLNITGIEVSDDDLILDNFEEIKNALPDPEKCILECWEDNGYYQFKNEILPFILFGVCVIMLAVCLKCYMMLKGAFISPIISVIYFCYAILLYLLDLGKVRKNTINLCINNFIISDKLRDKLHSSQTTRIIENKNPENEKQPILANNDSNGTFFQEPKEMPKTPQAIPSVK